MNFRALKAHYRPSSIFAIAAVAVLLAADAGR
jgi:hypothetical protein